MTQRKTHVTTGVAGLLLLTACASAADEPPSSRDLGVTTSRLDSVTSVRGYLYPIEAIDGYSPSVPTVREGDYERHSFGQKTFSTRQDRWLSVLVPSKARAQSFQAFGKSLDEHSDAVLRYLASTGFPTEQVLTVGGGADVIQVGLAEDFLSGLQPETRLIGFYTVISRAVEGIPVPVSKAIVQLADDGEPVTLHIDWPAIPSDVVDRARAWVSALDDVAARGALEALIGGGTQDAMSKRVVIMHRPGYSRAAAELPVAAFEVRLSDGNVKYFDEQGGQIEPAAGD